MITNCPKCGGTGQISCYGHIAQGVCFKCNGTGRVNASPESKDRKVQSPERKAELAALKADKLIIGTVDDAIKRAIDAIADKPSYKAEISLLINCFVREVSIAGLTLYQARIADEKLSKAIYRLPSSSDLSWLTINKPYTLNDGIIKQAIHNHIGR